MNTLTELLSPSETGIASLTPTDFSHTLAEGFSSKIGMLAKRFGANAESVRWAQQAAFAVSRATSAGHVCIPLSALAQYYAACVTEIRSALFASGIACDGTARAQALKPLVIDAQARLYLARYYEYERRLAYSLVIHMRRQNAEGVLDEFSSIAIIRERLQRFFGPLPKGGEIDWQRVAAVVASLSSGLVIVSGSPGTGKTTTIVGLLACLLDTCADLRIALAAPTGRAAQRMQEAVLTRAATLPFELTARLPKTAYTLHRLLGQSSGGLFRYHQDNPLPYDVVVVDEASMIDIAMATKLFDALAPQTQLVMLGDRDQLAAIEAGAVFAELSVYPEFSQSGMKFISAALEISVPKFAAELIALLDLSKAMHASTEFEALWDNKSAKSGNLFASPNDNGKCTVRSQTSTEVSSVLANRVVWLRRNYRFGLDSIIGQLSSVIRRGDAQATIDMLTFDPDLTANCPAAFYKEENVILAERTIARLSAGFIPYSQALNDALANRIPDLTPLFDALNQFCVLCATRSGPRGVDQLNKLLAARVRSSVHVPFTIGTSRYVGCPVMVTRNDYTLGLFNGDVGIALPGTDGLLYVHFRTGSDKRGSRIVSLAALPSYDAAFAMTVHQSQGSEFDRVGFVLPAGFSHVLSRELVYTAITRARKQVEVIGSCDVFAQAITTPTQRYSGFATRLAEVWRRQSQS